MTRTSADFSSLLRARVLPRLGGLGEILQFDNRLPLLAQRLLQPHSKLAVYRLGSVEAVADIANGDVNSVRACLVSPMYRELLQRLSLPSSPTILDLGANSGGFPLLMLSLGYTPRRIACVELNPRTALRLRYNLQINAPFESWSVQEAAVVGTAGPLRLQLGMGSTGDNIYQASGSSDGTWIDVRGETLDDVIFENFGAGPLDLCKIDIEGAEYEVFESTNHERISQCRNVLIEIHEIETERRDRLFRRFEQLGFHLVGGPSDRRFGVEYAFVKRD